MTPFGTVLKGSAGSGQDPVQRLLEDLSAGLGNLQSPHLYIQAAGSDGTDGSVAGVHLRWELLRELGENHIPKGNLAAGPGAPFPAPYGFNRSDDYVTILRLPYSRRYPCSINLDGQKPVERIESGATRSWRFKVSVEGRNPAVQREVVLRFADVSRYDQTRSSVNPNLPLSEFVGAYQGVIEAEVLGELCFSFFFLLPASRLRQDDQMRVEAVSVDSNEPGSELLISCRKKFVRQASASVRAENVKYFRFWSSMLTLQVIQLETYADFLAGSIEIKAAVSSLGAQFALSIDDQTVSTRLWGGSLSKISGRWPRYAGADPSTGRFTMNAANYEAKWDSTGDDGLKAGVADYLSLSTNPGNPTAIASLPSEQPGDHSAFEMSYLRMLKLVALDYHVARMLGLGCIDEAQPDPPVPYIYAAVYRTAAPIGTVGPPILLAPASKRMQPGETAQLSIGLSKPAPAGGVFVTVAGGTAVASVSPMTAFVQSGKTIATVLLSAATLTGTTIFSISAPGYGPATIQVHVAQSPKILLGGNAIIPLGDEQPFEVKLSEAAPGTGSSVDGSSPFARTHVYLTLPTTRVNDRRPPAPSQLAPTFGITLENGTATPTQLTDDDGYAPFDDDGARIINLHIEPFDTMRDFGPFFDPPTEFCSSDATKPVFYGCKYKLATELGYRVPELSSDDEFKDASGIFEVAPLIPQRPDAQTGRPVPIFSHTERENGRHEYALYGINWFSRASPFSNKVEVDTLIPKQNRLLPPSNLSVQLIQKEDSLLLTTQKERDRLDALTGDMTLIRCTLEWDQNHYHPQKLSDANQYADKVQFYFRQEPPRAVQGQIKSVTSISSSIVEVRTQSYTITSSSPAKTISPVISTNDEMRFSGSAFAANQVIYTVETAVQSTVNGEGPVFRLRKNLGTTASDFGNNNQYSTQLEVAAPSAGERFLVVENMNLTANWNGAPLAKEVGLKTFVTSSGLYREQVLYSDGTSKTFSTGGIYETARVTAPSDPNETPGVYEIVFDSYQLAPHPDPEVEWYRGTVRLPEPGSIDQRPSRPLQVYGLDRSGGTLKLIAYDSSAGSPGYVKPEMGTSIGVNFHPGYRFYLTAQAGVLDQGTTLPGPAQSAKETILAARAVNSTLGIESSLTQPAVVQARKLIDPVAPNEPVGPMDSSSTAPTSGPCSMFFTSGKPWP